MPNEEFMEKAGEALYGVTGETINTVRDKLVLARIATALESADASGYARGRAEVVAAEWHRVSEKEPPQGVWLETWLEGETGTTISTCRRFSEDEEFEWSAPDGRTTVTHHSYAAPSHWRGPSVPDALSQKDTRHEV